MTKKTVNEKIAKSLGLSIFFPIVGFILDSAFSQNLPSWWSSIPWLTIAAFVITLWLGFIVNELYRPDSYFRNWYRQKSEFAKISFKLGRPNIISEPQNVLIKIEIKKTIKQFNCLIRFARPVHYLSGNTEWKWEKQKPLAEENSLVHVGKIIEEEILKLDRSIEHSNEHSILCDLLSLKDSPFEQLIAFEVTVSSGKRTMTQRKIIQIVHSSKPTFIPFNEDTTTNFVES